MEVYPNYYDKFTCIADKCKHSCCIGWEIDVDEETMERYAALKTDFGEKIRKNIEGDPPHFILKAGDRCPFLNEKGLCEIILKSGEDMLCDICTLHPRFKNFYSSFEEVGLGLCCEEAARLILSCQDKFSIKEPNDIEPEEKEFFKNRQEIFDVLQDRNIPISERFLILARKFDLSFNFSPNEIYNKLCSLERLDEKWTEELEKLKDTNFDSKVFDDAPIAFEQLAVYFIFRHLTEALWDNDYAKVINFALVSCFIIGALWSKCDTLEKKYDVVRMYSSEIEYSEENTEIMKGWLYE